MKDSIFLKLAAINEWGGIFSERLPSLGASPVAMLEDLEERPGKELLSTNFSLSASSPREAATPQALTFCGRY